MTIERVKLNVAALTALKAFRRSKQRRACEIIDLLRNGSRRESERDFSDEQVRQLESWSTDEVLRREG
jgi:hypothetical protein